MTDRDQQIRRLTGRVTPEQAGLRLDQALARLFSDYSRSRLQQWIREDLVRVDGRTCRARDRVHAGEFVEVQARLDDKVPCRAQDIALDIRFEDADLFVIDKPPGLVVHPAAGNPEGTLQNGLLHIDPALVKLPRAGIVHRLDKDTSGLLVVARTPAAHRSLVEQLQARTIKREYRALVTGVMASGGTLDAPIGRHPVHRIRMAVVRGGKPAVTHYRVLQRFRAHTWLKVSLETGRTHQIRVHLAYLRYPLVGDQTYAGRFRLPAGVSPHLAAALRGFQRQALHAAKLGLRHPDSGHYLEWQAPLPDDMQALLDAVQRDLQQNR